MAEQRTLMLDAVRKAYVKDVLAIKFFLQEQVRIDPWGRGGGLSSMHIYGNVLVASLQTEAFLCFLDHCCNWV